jgi:hypothetical protein
MYPFQSTPRGAEFSVLAFRTQLTTGVGQVPVGASEHNGLPYSLVLHLLFEIIEYRLWRVAPHISVIVSAGNIERDCCDPSMCATVHGSHMKRDVRVVY